MSASAEQRVEQIFAKAICHPLSDLRNARRNCMDDLLDCQPRRADRPARGGTGARSDGPHDVDGARRRAAGDQSAGAGARRHAVDWFRDRADQLRWTRFRKFNHRPASRTSGCGGLFAPVTKDGTLWVGFSEPARRASRLACDRLRQRGQQPLSIVDQPREAPMAASGRIANRRQLISFDQDGTWHLEADRSTTRLRGLFIDPSNTLWLVQEDISTDARCTQPPFSRTNVPETSASGLRKRRTDISGSRTWDTPVERAGRNSSTSRATWFRCCRSHNMRPTCAPPPTAR